MFFSLRVPASWTGAPSARTVKPPPKGGSATKKAGRLSCLFVVHFQGLEPWARWLRGSYTYVCYRLNIHFMLSVAPTHIIFSRMSLSFSNHKMIKNTPIFTLQQILQQNIFPLATNPSKWPSNCPIMPNLNSVPLRYFFVPLFSFWSPIIYNVRPSSHFTFFWSFIYD